MKLGLERISEARRLISLGGTSRAVKDSGRPEVGLEGFESRIRRDHPGRLSALNKDVGVLGLEDCTLSSIFPNQMISLKDIFPSRASLQKEYNILQSLMLSV